MRYGPWPRKRPVAAAFVFFFLLPAPLQSWWIRSCQGCACAPSGARPALDVAPPGLHCASPGGRKTPQQPAAACGCQGPATAMCPAAMAGGQGEGARARPRCPAAPSPASKRPFDLQRSAATCAGCGGTLPPRGSPAHARASSGTRVRLLFPGTRNACTEVRLARPPALAGCQTAVAVLLVRAAHPMLAGGGSPDSGEHASHQDHLLLQQRSAHAPVPGAASRSAAEGLALTQKPCGSTVRALQGGSQESRGTGGGRAALPPVAGRLPGWEDAQGGSAKPPRTAARWRSHRYRQECERAAKPPQEGEGGWQA